MQDLSDTLMIIGTTDFGKLVDDSKVIKRSNTDNITVFAPTNKAVKELEAKVTENLRQTLSFLVDSFL